MVRFKQQGFVFMLCLLVITTQQAEYTQCSTFWLTEKVTF